MTSKPNFGNDLPPGVTRKDIEPEDRTCQECDGKGVKLVVFDDSPEYYRTAICPRCLGTGDEP